MGTAARKLERPLRKYLLKQTRKYAEVVGPIMVGYLQRKVGILVEGSGEHAIRSEMGEYPRKETGSLSASMDYRVENRGNRIVLIFGSLKNVRLGGKRTSPTVYARYLVRIFKRKLARSAWDDAKRTGALRKALNRLRVPYRKGLIESRVFPISGTGAHSKKVDITNIQRR